MTITLAELRELNGRYCRGISEWSTATGSQLDELIQEAKSCDGGVALDILSRVPAKHFSSRQFTELFSSLLFWIQGPSRFYEKAIAILAKFGAFFLNEFRESLNDACARGDDSLVRGLCHVFSLLDLDVQRQLRECVIQQRHKGNADVQEALGDLSERSMQFANDSSHSDHV